MLPPPPLDSERLKSAVLSAPQRSSEKILQGTTKFSAD